MAKKARPTPAENPPAELVTIGSAQDNVASFSSDHIHISNPDGDLVVGAVASRIGHFA